MAVERKSGRGIELGNGKIRVKGPDWLLLADDSGKPEATRGKERNRESLI